MDILENGGSPVAASKAEAADKPQQQQEVKIACNHNNGNGKNIGIKEEKANNEENDLPERCETRFFIS